jgi:glycerophosphoryl diester phosphodiesterase
MPAPDIVAHRGGSAFPENSFSGLKYACSLGVEQLEFDIHLTRENELAIIHDPTLDQTTQATGRVGERSLRELAAVRLRGIDEGVPSFDEVMEFLAGEKIHVRIEIKKDPRDGAYARMHDRVMRALNRHRMTERVTLMSFELQALPAFSRDGVKTSLSWMQHGQTTLDEFDGQLAGFKAMRIDDIGLSYGPTTPAILERVARHGMTAGIWTVNGPGRLDYWLGMPVSYIITDQPDLALRLRTKA